MASVPKFEGHLDNPNWGFGENRDYDKGEHRNTPGLAREEALDVPIGSTHEIPKVKLGGGEKEKTTKPANSASSRRSFTPRREATEHTVAIERADQQGGEQILDRTPEKKQMDDKAIRAARRTLGLPEK